MLTFHTKKPIKCLPFTLVVLWITAGMFIGCTKDSMQMRKKGSKKGSLLRNLPPQPRVLSEPSQQKATVVLLHDLNGTNDDMKSIANKISTQCGNSVRILQPTFRKEGQSANLSIANQAKKLLEYIQKEVADAATAPLHIIGYSQGGVLACIFANRYKDQCSILDIVAMGAPFTGVPAFQRTETDVQDFLNNIDTQTGLSWILPRGLSSEAISSCMKGSALLIAAARSVPSWGAGALDLLPDSECLQEVSSFLRQGSHNIPCLLLASHQNDFSEIFPIECKEEMDLEKYTTDVKQFNKAYAQFITNDTNGRPHDTLIPLRSQLCRTNSFDDLKTAEATSDPLMVATPNQPDITGYIYKNTIHARKLIALHKDLHADKTETIHTSERVLDHIMRFIGERLPEPKSVTAEMSSLTLN